MTRPRRLSTGVLSVIAGLMLVVLTPVPARAQLAFDLVGARALGMAGAFTAVTGDPTAGLWNPPGLIEGPPAGLTIGWDSFHFRDPNAPPVPGSGRVSAFTAAVGTWPLGISFVRVAASGIGTAESAGLEVGSLTTSQVGFTVLHSVADAFVAGATLKVINGASSFGPVSAGSAGDVLDSAFSSASSGQWAFDLDIGLLARTDKFRAALTLKNLRRPGFVPVGGKTIYLERLARIGVAVLPKDGVTLALDVGLDTADPLVGLRRSIALGGETRLGMRLMLRGGIRWQRDAASRPIGALGGSVCFRQGLWLDGYFTQGRAGGDRGFGVAIRVGS